jgi:hypothetical protein
VNNTEGWRWWRHITQVSFPPNNAQTISLATDQEFRSLLRTKLWNSTVEKADIPENRSVHYLGMYLTQWDEVAVVLQYYIPVQVPLSRVQALSLLLREVYGHIIKCQGYLSWQIYALLKKIFWPGMVDYLLTPVIPATTQEIRRLVVWGHSRQKVSKTPSQSISWVW